MFEAKLEDAKAYFFELYPEGFDDEGLVKIKQRHNTAKISEQVHELFHPDVFGMPEQVCENYAKIVAKSSLISLFEKPKVKEMVASMSHGKKDMFSIALYELLFGDKEDGFESLVELLAPYKLAKWSLVSLIPYYYFRDQEFFIKPTTTKNVLKHFGIEHLQYKPRPSYGFYVEYKKILESMKKTADLGVEDNAAFTGFLMMSMEE